MGNSMTRADKMGEVFNGKPVGSNLVRLFQQMRADGVAEFKTSDGESVKSASNDAGFVPGHCEK